MLPHVLLLLFMFFMPLGAYSFRFIIIYVLLKRCYCRTVLLHRVTRTVLPHRLHRLPGTERLLPHVLFLPGTERLFYRMFLVYRMPWVHPCTHPVYTPTCTRIHPVYTRIYTAFT